MPFYFGVGKVSLALKQGLTQIRNVKSPAVSNRPGFLLVPNNSIDGLVDKLISLSGALRT